MRLAIFAEVGSVIVQHGGGVVENSFLLHLVDRNHHRNMQFPGKVLH